MRLEFSPNESHLARVEKKLIERLRKAEVAMGLEAHENCVKATELTKQWSAVTTGESQEAVHVIGPLRLSEQGFKSGVAIGKTSNSQAVRTERGDFVPTTDMSQKDGGVGHGRTRLNSSGFPGGWGDESETVNVRELRGTVRANASARMQPLGSAVAAIFGPIINLLAAKSFRKGILNLYTRSSQTNLGDSPIKQKLKIAARRVVTGTAFLMLCLISVSNAQPPLNQWNMATVIPQNWRTDSLFAKTDTLLLPGVWKFSRIFSINHMANSPQFFQLYADPDGYGASQGNAKIGVLTFTGWDSLSCTSIPWDVVVGDTLWSLKYTLAPNNLNNFNIPLLFGVGTYGRIGLRSDAASDTVNFSPDSTRVVQKH